MPLEPKNADDVLEKDEHKPAKSAAIASCSTTTTTRPNRFVVHVLAQFFHMSETSATTFMMAVHRNGKGVAGVYSRDIAETKAATICDYAKMFEMPLLVTAEPEENGDD